jgi:hypothetical protein
VHYNAPLGGQTGHDLKHSVGRFWCPYFSPAIFIAFWDRVGKSQATWADADTLMESVFAACSGKIATTLTAYAKVGQRGRNGPFNTLASIAEARWYIVPVAKSAWPDVGRRFGFASLLAAY